MSIRIIIAGLLGLGLACGAIWAALPGSARPPLAPATHPVVVELFQSQGCSDCPPAQANINLLADRPDVLALSYGVTYWDYLGWKDSFASPRFTARQWDYARRNGRNQVATPQIWVDGRTTIVGSNAAQLETTIKKAAPYTRPILSAHDGRLTVAAGPPPSDGADIWLVRYNPTTVQVAIRAGENGGRTLPHRDIVLDLIKLGHWTGRNQSLALPHSAAGPLKEAILLQAGPGGPILDALRI